MDLGSFVDCLKINNTPGEGLRDGLTDGVTDWLEINNPSKGGTK